MTSYTNLFMTWEYLESSKGLCSSLGLVWNHASYCSPEDPAGGSKMEGTAGGLHIATQLQKFEVLHCKR